MSRTESTRLLDAASRFAVVLDGLVAGQSNTTIGRDLAISTRTIEIYRANVMTAMQASNVSELVRLAMRTGTA